MTIFSKIISKEVPAKIIYEDDLCLAFHDIDAKAPVHVLLIPKKVIRSLATLTGEDKSLMGHMMLKVGEVAHKLGLEENGYRVVTNIGDDGGQSVPHLHFHILGGRKLAWPPG